MKIRITAAGAVLALSVGVGAGAVASSRTVDLRVQGPNDTSLALEVLQTIPVENEYSRGYNRSLFKHWLDVDGDDCNSREQVLKRDAVGFAQVDPFKCFVVEADWVSPYDGKKTTDRTAVDVDHMVPLKEAWDSGAWQWTESQRTAYANDTSDSRTLIAVSSSSNRSKSDKDPSNWMPSLRGYWCTYISNWIAVKARWGLSMDQSEWGRAKNLLNGQCVGTTTRGWVATPVAVSVTTTLPSATTISSATTLPSTTTTIASTTPRATTTLPSTTATTVASTTTLAQGGTPSAPTVRPGSFCTPEGAGGTYNGKAYVCAKTDAKGTPYKDNRARWRQQV